MGEPPLFLIRQSLVPAVPPSTALACWCGSPNCRQQFRTSNFGLLRCGSCGCYRIDPPPITHDVEAASFYTCYYDRRGLDELVRPDAVRTSRFWEVVRAEPSLEDAGYAVADIGCGDGHLCNELRHAGWSRVIGIDVSRARIQRARRLYPDGEFYDCPIHQVGVTRESLDLIVMDNVIEHLAEPMMMVRRLRRYLGPQGRFVVITPNMTSGHFRLLGRHWTPELAPHAHIYLFTPESMRMLLSNAGFEVQSIGSFHLPMYSAAALRARLSADVRGALWRVMQELGGVYGRLIGTGPMLYAVARPASHA